ncbi:MAG: hypothetical protein HC927_04335 [Deltaproteobacteria bacterium]|nr:hypothetical protein [Deltaproteobacteria bacterium]
MPCHSGICQVQTPVADLAEVGGPRDLPHVDLVGAHDLAVADVVLQVAPRVAAQRRHERIRPLLDDVVVGPGRVDRQQLLDLAEQVGDQHRRTGAVEDQALDRVRARARVHMLACEIDPRDPPAHDLDPPRVDHHLLELGPGHVHGLADLARADREERDLGGGDEGGPVLGRVRGQRANAREQGGELGVAKELGDQRLADLVAGRLGVDDDHPLAGEEVPQHEPSDARADDEVLDLLHGLQGTSAAATCEPARTRAVQ